MPNNGNDYSEFRKENPQVWAQFISYINLIDSGKLIDSLKQLKGEDWMTLKNYSIEEVQKLKNRIVYLRDETELPWHIIAQRFRLPRNEVQDIYKEAKNGTKENSY